VGATVGTVVASNANTYAVISGSINYGITYAGNVTIVSVPTNGITQTITIQAINGVGAAYTSLSITTSCGTSSSTSSVSTSSSGTSSTGTVTGTIGFSQTNFVFNVTSCQTGSTVGTVTAGGSPTFSIAAGGTGFNINSQTGTVSINGAVNNVQAFLVQATNSGTNTYATVTVNCGSGGTGTSGGSGGPQFTQSSYTFYPVACGPGVIVGSVTAIGGGSITYTSNGLPYWSVEPATGIISSGTTIPNSDIFVVTAQSSLGTATTTVTTTSNCPDYFTFTVRSCQAGTVVVPATAVTGITGGGVTSYTLSGPNSGTLTLNQGTGQITSSRTLTSGTFTYVLTATVPGGSYTAFITLLVTCGGTSVAFSMPTYSATIPCSSTPVRAGVASVSPWFCS
jgi:hypothetical protein